MYLKRGLPNSWNSLIGCNPFRIWSSIDPACLPHLLELPSSSYDQLAQTFQQWRPGGIAHHMKASPNGRGTIDLYMGNVYQVYCNAHVCPASPKKDTPMYSELFIVKYSCKNNCMCGGDRYLVLVQCLV